MFNLEKAVRPHQGRNGREAVKERTSLVAAWRFHRCVASGRNRIGSFGRLFQPARLEELLKGFTFGEYVVVAEVGVEKHQAIGAERGGRHGDIPGGAEFRG